MYTDFLKEKNVKIRLTNDRPEKVSFITLSIGKLLITFILACKVWSHIMC